MSTGQFRAAWLASAFLLSATCGLAIAGTVADCNQNGVPDAEDLLSPDFGDCNNNGVLDICDVDPADPDGDTLVSIDRNNNKRPDECDLGGQLIGPGVKINPKTGHATKLPPHPPNGLTTEVRLDGIAFAPDGTLYAIREQNLLVIDRVAWTATVVATLSRRIGTPTFSPDGQLYAIVSVLDGCCGHYYYSLTEELATVDLQTGTVTTLGVIEDLPSTSGIAFSPNGTLHAVDAEYYIPFYGGDWEYPLYAVNLTTLVATPVAYYPAEFYGTQVYGLTFQPDGEPIICTSNHPDQEFAGCEPNWITVGAFDSCPRSMAISPNDDAFYATYWDKEALFDLRAHAYLINDPAFNFGDHAASPADGEVYAFSNRVHRIERDTGNWTGLVYYGDTTVREATICSTWGFALYDQRHWCYPKDPCDSNPWICGWKSGSFCVNPATWETHRCGSLANASDIIALTCVEGAVYGVDRTTNQVVAIVFSLSPSTAQTVPISTLSVPVSNLAATPGGIVYAVDSVQLSTVDLQTGSVVAIGPLGIFVRDIAYAPPIMNNARLQDAATCLSGPAAESSDECEYYDFNGDGAVDLRDLSGLWLIDQR